MSADDPDRVRGLYGKYVVFKARSMEPVLGPVFVLNYSKDPHARVALQAYIDSCADDYPLLAADLREMLEKTRG